MTKNDLPNYHKVTPRGGATYMGSIPHCSICKSYKHIMRTGRECGRARHLSLTSARDCMKVTNGKKHVGDSCVCDLFEYSDEAKKIFTL